MAILHINYDNGTILESKKFGATYPVADFQIYNYMMIVDTGGSPIIGF